MAANGEWPPPTLESHQPSAAPDTFAAANNQEDETGGGGAADRISDLPDGVLILILSALSIRESVRASVLSRRWRHLWTFAPLDINHSRLYIEDSGFDPERQCHCCWFLRAIDGILSRHQGPIRGFHLLLHLFHHSSTVCGLREQPEPGPSSIERALGLWMEVLVQRGIQEVTLRYEPPSPLLACPSLCTLDLTGSESFNELTPVLPPNLRELKLRDGHFQHDEKLSALPGGILACQSLCSLELTGYSLEESFAMRMPPILRELRLNFAHMSDGLLRLLLSSCQLLDGLHLHHCYCKSILINSSSLRKLEISTIELNGEWPPIIIEDVPNLELLDLVSYCTKSSIVEIIRAPKLQWLGWVDARVKMLRLGSNCFQNGSLKASNTQIHSLKTLSIEVSLDNACQRKLVADLLRCCPCLENLDIQ